MREVRVDRLRARTARLSRGSHGSTLRTVEPNAKPLVVVRVDDRLQAHAVAHDVHALRAEVDDREREHAAQPRQQRLDAPRLVAAQDELGVAPRREAHVARLELARVGLPAVDLAVVADPDRAVVVAHRLVGDRARVDDRQPRVHERRRRAGASSGRRAPARRTPRRAARPGRGARSARACVRARRGRAGLPKWPAMPHISGPLRTPCANTASIASSMRSMPKLALRVLARGVPHALAQLGVAS